MTPNKAAAILVVPALLTNVWQMWDGPALKILFRHLWPMLVCALLGTLPAAGILTKANVRLTTALLGGILVVYALFGLIGVHFKVSRRTEPVLGPVDKGPGDYFRGRQRRPVETNRRAPLARRQQSGPCRRRPMAA
jgi:uncharacterized protein